MQIYNNNSPGFDSVIEPSLIADFKAGNGGGSSATLIEKTVTENGTYTASDDNADGYSKVTVNVSGGATVGADVIFYDYDGTVVTSYTATEFANLAVMPSNPTHEGLTAQGWNWSLADAKAYVNKYGKLNIGQMYVTDDGKTRLYITLPEGRTSPILQLYLNDNSELDIDWGDGSTHSTFTSTSADYKSERHEYATSGNYVIAVTVVNGGFVLQSSIMYTSSMLWNGNEGDSESSSPNRAYSNAVKKIEMGDSVTSIGQRAFCDCKSLSSITIPNGVTSTGNSLFRGCSSLLSITIPNGFTSIGAEAFSSCTSLSSITIPNGVTGIDWSAFNSCSSLSSVTIPDGVTSIGEEAFKDCSYMSYIKFEPTTPPTVAKPNAWDNVSTSTKILVPAGKLAAYKSAPNYPNPSTYTYEEY